MNDVDNTPSTEYRRIMEEIKERLSITHRIARGTLQLPGYAARELFYLQLRMMCELIAIACLKMHGDMAVKPSKKTLKAYQPKLILDALQRVHPSFYPMPVEEHLDPDGDLEAITPVSNGAITRSEITDLWVECGKILHKGSAKSYAPPQKGELIPAIQWTNKIVALLNRHLIRRYNDKNATYVMMQTKESGGVALMHLTLQDDTHWPDWQKTLRPMER